MQIAENNDAELVGLLSSDQLRLIDMIYTSGEYFNSDHDVIKQVIAECNWKPLKIGYSQKTI